MPVTEEELKIQAIEKIKTHLRLPDSVSKNKILFVNSMETLIEASDVLGLPYSSDTSSSSSSTSTSTSTSTSLSSKRVQVDVKKGKNQNVAVLIIDSNNNNYKLLIVLIIHDLLFQYCRQ